MSLGRTAHAVFDTKEIVALIAKIEDKDKALGKIMDIAQAECMKLPRVLE